MTRGYGDEADDGHEYQSRPITDERMDAFIIAWNRACYGEEPEPEDIDEWEEVRTRQ